MFLNTSQDILYISLAICAVWLTAFMCWGLYYVVMTTKRIFTLIDRITSITKQVQFVVDSVHEKINAAGGQFALAAQIVKQIIEYVQEKKASKPKTKKKTTTKKK